MRLLSILTSIEQYTISARIIDGPSALAFALVLTTLVTGFTAPPTDLVLVLEAVHVVMVVVIFVVLFVRDARPCTHPTAPFTAQTARNR